LYDNAIKPVIDLIVAYVKMMANMYLWLWHNVVEPVAHGIGTGMTWLYNVGIKPIFNSIGSAIHTVGNVFSWLWKNAVEPAWHGISNALSGTWNFMKSIFNSMVSAVQWVGKSIASVLDWVGRQIDRATGAINSVSSMLGFHAFADGGPVPGPDGAAQLAIVHGGEYVLSREMIANITSSGNSNPVDALSTQQVAIASVGSAPSGNSGTVVLVNVNVQGSLLAQRNLEDNIRSAVLQTNIRNPTNQLSLPAGR
jgi:hypothetical protein